MGGERPISVFFQNPFGFRFLIMTENKKNLDEIAYWKKKNYSQLLILIIYRQWGRMWSVRANVVKSGKKSGKSGKDPDFTFKWSLFHEVDSVF